jgi:hypothetical protein
MFSGNLHDQTIIKISQEDDIANLAESFLIDRQAGNFPNTPYSSTDSS